MYRRDFLVRVGGLTLAVASVGVLEACSGSDDEGPADPGAGTCPAGTVSGGNINFTNTDPGHKHTAALAQTDIDAPPASGRTITVSTASGHAHTIVLSQADFQSIKDGNKINKASSNNDGHSHAYCLWKA